jgi:hypothetical protein
MGAAIVKSDHFTRQSVLPAVSAPSSPEMIRAEKSLKICELCRSGIDTRGDHVPRKAAEPRNPVVD